jgi:hypothetical protein
LTYIFSITYPGGTGSFILGERTKQIDAGVIHMSILNRFLPKIFTIAKVVSNDSLLYAEAALSAVNGNWDVIGLEYRREPSEEGFALWSTDVKIFSGIENGAKLAPRRFIK